MRPWLPVITGLALYGLGASGASAQTADPEQAFEITATRLVLDTCLPALRGAPLEETPGYAAIGRPPIERGVSDQDTPFSLVVAGGYRMMTGRDSCVLWSLDAAPAPASLIRDRLISEPGFTVVTAPGETRWEILTADASAMIAEESDGGVEVNAAWLPPVAMRRFFTLRAALSERSAAEAVLAAIDLCPIYQDRIVFLDSEGATDIDDGAVTALQIRTTGTTDDRFRLRGRDEVVLYDAGERGSRTWRCTIDARPAESTADLASAVSSGLATKSSIWTAQGENSWLRADGATLSLTSAEGVARFTLDPHLPAPEF